VQPVSLETWWVVAIGSHFTNAFVYLGVGLQRTQLIAGELIEASLAFLCVDLALCLLNLLLRDESLGLDFLQELDKGQHASHDDSNAVTFCSAALGIDIPCDEVLVASEAMDGGCRRQRLARAWQQYRNETVPSAAGTTRDI
jgi:hypothetical protein